MPLNNQITALMGLGADAMDNLYDVDVHVPDQLTPPNDADGELLRKLRIRALGFTPPAFTQSLYEVRYKTVGIRRPASKIEGNREFKISFRLDANYEVYRVLQAWRARFHLADTGYATNRIDPNSLGRVKVYALAEPVIANAAADSSQPIHKAYQDVQGISGPFGEAAPNEAAVGQGNDDRRKTGAIVSWEFYDVWCSQVDEPAYKQGGGAALEISATFQFANFYTPLLFSATADSLTGDGGGAGGAGPTGNFPSNNNIA